MIPTLAKQILGPQSEIQIRNTKSSRDFIDVRDAVEALILIGEKRAPGVFNVASGNETSIPEAPEFCKNWRARKKPCSRPKSSAPTKSCIAARIFRN